MSRQTGNTFLGILYENDTINETNRDNHNLVIVMVTTYIFSILSLGVKTPQYLEFLRILLITFKLSNKFVKFVVGYQSV